MKKVVKWLAGTFIQLRLGRWADQWSPLALIASDYCDQWMQSHHIGLSLSWSLIQIILQYVGWCKHPSLSDVQSVYARAQLFKETQVRAKYGKSQDSFGTHPSDHSQVSNV